MRMLVDLRQSVGAAAERVRRVTYGALGLRIAVIVTGLAAFMLAVPPDIRTAPVPFVGMAILALGTAIAPGSWLSALLELSAVGAWLGWTFGGDGEVTWSRLTLLALLLYGHHVLCVWASAVPMDTVLEARVLRTALVRYAVVGAVTAALGALALQLAGQLDLGATSELAVSVAIPVLGVLAVLVLTATLAFLLRRR